MTTRPDQRHDRYGQFTPRAGHENQQEEERLEYPIGCKVSAHEIRRYTILFDQNRREFGWQTMSDMYRSMLDDGYRNKVEQVKNPTPEMKRHKRNAEERQRIQMEAAKHRDFDIALMKTDNDIRDTLDAGDLAGVRRILIEFKGKTKDEDDPAIRVRREVEFERRWGRLLEGLNKGVSVTEFIDED